MKRFDGQYSLPPSAQTIVTAPPPQDLDPDAADRYPSTAERVVQFVRDVLASVALVMVIVVLVLLAHFMVSVAAAVDQWRATSAATGCPVGERCG
jgi:hypothetical protein